MRRGKKAALFLAALATGWLGSMATATAQFELWQTEDTFAELNANLQILTAYLDMGDLARLSAMTDEEAAIPQDVGMGGAVGRLEWHFDLGRRVDVDVHNRFFWQTSPLLAAPDVVDEEDALLTGFDVSAGADRRVDTELTLVDGDTTRLTHDLDRLVVSMYFGAADVYLGRQAIRWGVSDLFGVSDRFAPLSPFELDTLQRRGIDAARVITHLSPSLELDFVAADRGEGEPIALAGRLEYFGTDVDAYIATGRFWNRLSAMSGISYLTGNWKFFGEGEALWNLDDDEFDRPRATVGAQRVGMNHQIGLEYHFNGFGVAPGDDYALAFFQPPPEVERGETYFLGRHYAGATGMYMSDAGWGAGGGAIANLTDPSVVVFPMLEYEIEEQFTVAAGAYIGFGRGIDLPEPENGQADQNGQGQMILPSVPTEFGATPDMYFLQMTAFF